MTSIIQFMILPVLLWLLMTCVILPASSLAAKTGMGFIVVAATAFVARICTPRRRLPVNGKAVLITGCDSGFGLRLAKHLHSLGFLVFAGCLMKNRAGGSGSKELEDVDPGRLFVLQLDVTSEQEVKEAVQLIKEKLPNKTDGLWAIVNNAGASSFGEVEWCSTEKYRFIYEVNVLGMIRITKAVLPLIRKAKGRVVNMASGISRHAVPSRSLYCTSKFAVQGFSDCLRYEMRRWGVRVSLIEPGNYIAATGILSEKMVSETAKELWEGMAEDVKQDYGRDYFDKVMNTMQSYCSSGCGDTSPVVEAYTDAVISETPKIRYYPMNLYWHIRRLVFTHLPESIADRLYHGIIY